MIYNLDILNYILKTRQKQHGGAHLGGIWKQYYVHDHWLKRRVPDHQLEQLRIVPSGL